MYIGEGPESDQIRATSKMIGQKEPRKWCPYKQHKPPWQLLQWSSGTLPFDPADWSREEHLTRLGRWASSPSGLGGKLERAWAVSGLARNRRWPCFLQWRGQRGQRASGGSGREGRRKAEPSGRILARRVQGPGCTDLSAVLPQTPQASVTPGM